MDYTTQRSSSGGFRFDVRNPPAAGTQLKLTCGRVVTYQGSGIAGLLQVTDGEGCEHLVMPHQVRELGQAAGVTS